MFQGTIDEAKAKAVEEGKWLVSVSLLHWLSLLNDWQMAGEGISLILIVLWMLSDTWAAQASLACCTQP